MNNKLAYVLVAGVAVVGTVAAYEIVGAVSELYGAVNAPAGPDKALREARREERKAERGGAPRPEVPTEEGDHLVLIDGKKVVLSSEELDIRRRARQEWRERLTPEELQAQKDKIRARKLGMTEDELDQRRERREIRVRLLQQVEGVVPQGDATQATRGSAPPEELFETDLLMELDER